jgi:hypothetical protein
MRSGETCSSASSGMMQATIDLAKPLGGEIAGLAVAIELDSLKGRAKFPAYDVFSPPLRRVSAKPSFDRSWSNSLSLSLL